MSLYMFDSIYSSIKRLKSIKSMLEKKKKGNKIAVNLDIMSENIGDALRMIAMGFMETHAVLRYEMPREFYQIEEKAKEILPPYLELFMDKTADEVTIDQYYDAIASIVKLADEISEDDFARWIGENASYCLKSDWSTSWLKSNVRFRTSDLNRLFDIVNNSSKRPFTVFDANAMQGEILATISDKFNKDCAPEDRVAKCYGISSETYLGNQKRREKVERLALYGLTGARISQDTFDVGFVVTELDNKKESGFKLRPDRSIIRATIEHTRAGGIVIAAIPVFRLYKDLAMDMAKQLEDINIVAFENPFFEQFRCVFIVGKKKMTGRGTVDIDAFIKIRNAYRHTKDYLVYDDDSVKFSYELPPDFRPVAQFRGSKLESGEVLAMTKNSSAAKEFWRSQYVQKMSDAGIHPVLPPNFGQLGQLIASGMMDGIVMEGDGASHLAKGRVVKYHETKTTHDALTHRVTVSEKISNRVEINALLPSGDFRHLA